MRFSAFSTNTNENIHNRIILPRLVVTDFVRRTASMELHKVPPLSFTSAAAAVVLIAALAYYSLRSGKSRSLSPFSSPNLVGKAREPPSSRRQTASFALECLMDIVERRTTITLSHERLRVLAFEGVQGTAYHLLFLSIAADVVEVDVEEATVSVCQIRVHVETTYSFDDRTLVALLAKLKAYDFQIGQPVWGSADTLLYLCEHRLRGGMKQVTVDRELNNVIKNGPYSSGRLVWSCA